MCGPPVLPVSLALSAATGYTPIPVYQARDELRAAAQASASQPFSTTRQAFAGSVDVLRYSAAGSFERVSGTVQHPRQETVRIFSHGTWFQAIPRKDQLRTKVRGYLQSPLLDCTLLPEVAGWDATMQSRSAAVFDFGPLTRARVEVRADGTRGFRIREGRSHRYACTVDASGRLVALSAWWREKGSWVRSGVVSWSFEELTIDHPGPGEALPEAVVVPAAEAAGIPDRLRAILRVATSGTGSVAELRHSVRGNVQQYNHGVTSIPARIKPTPIPHGMRVWGHNQYSDVTYAWRIVQHHGRWIARRV